MQVAVAVLEATAKARLEQAGVAPDRAALVARSLVDADQRGVSSHGAARMPMYVDAIEGGSIDPGATPTIVQDSPAASLWHGNKALGQVSSTIIVDHAVTQAQSVGAHVAVCHSTNHFGAAAFWTRRAATADCACLAFTSSHPLIVPTRGKSSELGTNPIAFALNGNSNEFVLDMATSTAALGKVEVADRRDEAIPDGWAVDPDGKTVNDPKLVYPGVLEGNAGGLLPIGGASEVTGGHKGYGLAAMVEVLCSVLGGGHDLTPGRPLADRTAGLWPVSHSFIVIDTAHLAGRETTADALDRMVEALRESPPLEPDLPVLVHGDKENAAAATQQDLVEIDDSVWEYLTS